MQIYLAVTFGGNTPPAAVPTRTRQINYEKGIYKRIGDILKLEILTLWKIVSFRISLPIYVHKFVTHLGGIPTREEYSTDIMVEMRIMWQGKRLF